jgi:hypothetical protein
MIILKKAIRDEYMAIQALWVLSLTGRVLTAALTAKPEKVQRAALPLWQPTSVTSTTFLAYYSAGEDKTSGTIETNCKRKTARRLQRQRQIGLIVNTGVTTSWATTPYSYIIGTADSYFQSCRVDHTMSLVSADAFTAKYSSVPYTPYCTIYTECSDGLMLGNLVSTGSTYTSTTYTCQNDFSRCFTYTLFDKFVSNIPVRIAIATFVNFVPRRLGGHNEWFHIICLLSQHQRAGDHNYIV